MYSWLRLIDCQTRVCVIWLSLEEAKCFISSLCQSMFNAESTSVIDVPPGHCFIEFEQVLPSCSLPLKKYLEDVVYVFAHSLIDLTLSLGYRSRWAQGHPPYLPLLQWKPCYERLCLPTLTCNDYYVLTQSYTNYSDALSAELPQDMGSEEGFSSFRFHWFGFSNWSCWNL